MLCAERQFVRPLGQHHPCKKCPEPENTFYAQNTSCTQLMKNYQCCCFVDLNKLEGMSLEPTSCHYLLRKVLADLSLVTDDYEKSLEI